MKNVVTIRLPDEYVGMLENIKLELSDRGLEIKDNILIKTVLLTGIRTAQRAYFKTRSQNDLIRSRCLESQLDKELNDYFNPQTKLFE